MEQEQKTKQELLEIAKQLAEKHSFLKETVLDILIDIDKIEKEYLEIIKQIKSK